jgi:Ca2+-binding EF-hand superfamily protein
MSTVDSSNSSAWSQTLSSLSGAMSTYLQDKMLKKMDADGSGGVEQSEFQAALEKVAGKLGIDVGEGASELYASLDADQNGSLNGSEVGSLLQSLFASASNTQAFVQSRGDEARFAELDADSDGQISMAEFGITPAAETTVITTTTVISSTQEGAAAEGASTLAASEEAVAAAAAPGSQAAEEQAVASAESAAATEDASLQALMQSVDTDGSGDISSTELNSFVAKLNAQAEAATKRYNDTALASLGSQSGGLNATA